VLGPAVSDEERDTLDEAKDFLDDVLGAGAVDAVQVKREAKAAGVSETTLKRAKKAKSVVSKRVGGPGSAGHWTWELPEADSLRVPTPIHSTGPLSEKRHESSGTGSSEALRGPTGGNGSLRFSAEERAAAKRLYSDARFAEIEREDAERREREATLFADDPGFLGSAKRGRRTA